jgi:hypothetical protein
MQDHDAIQRLLNEAKKAELTERFGALFQSCTHDVPPMVESAWLRQVEEFELRCRGAGTTTVRRYIGSPPVRPVGMIPAGELETELGCLMEILESNNVRIEFGRPLSPAEQYRFVTEELLDREIEDIRMEGLVLNFLYEESHPDDEREATLIGEDFFFAFFNREEAILSNIIGLKRIELSAGGPESFHSRLEDARAAFSRFTDWDARVIDCTVDLDRAILSASVRWSALRAGSGETLTRTGRALLRLRKVGLLWYVIDAEVPGILTLTS